MAALDYSPFGRRLLFKSAPPAPKEEEKDKR